MIIKWNFHLKLITWHTLFCKKLYVFPVHIPIPMMTSAYANKRYAGHIYLGRKDQWTATHATGMSPTMKRSSRDKTPIECICLDLPNFTVKSWPLQDFSPCRLGDNQGPGWRAIGRRDTKHQNVRAGLRGEAEGQEMWAGAAEWNRKRFPLHLHLSN